MLRKLQPQTNKIIRDMALTFDIREDIVYQQGLSDAKEEAIIKTARQECSRTFCIMLV